MDTVEVESRDCNTPVAEVAVGRRYRILATGTWTDWTIRADATGYARWYLRPFEVMRRHPGAAWFALVGFVAPAPLADRDAYEPEEAALLDLSGHADGKRPWTAPADGHLHVFANDLPSMYGNNRGRIEVGIEAWPD